MADKINNTFIMPTCCATKPKNEIHKATIPQQNPFTKPDTMLLYFGNIFCASTRTTGCANIVVNPIKPNTKSENNGIDLYVKANTIVKGKLDHIEK